MANEKATDQIVRDILREIGFERPWKQDGGPRRKRDAPKGGSKPASANAEDKPEFIFVSSGFVVTVGDKKDVQRTRYLVDGDPITEYPYRADYALSDAIHCVKTMLASGIPFDKSVFAMGVGGGEVRHEIAVSYLALGFVKHLDDLDNLDVFSEEEIGECYAVWILGQRPHVGVQLDDARATAERLHEGMRNYGSVENDRRASLVSAILLALRNPYFNIDRLMSVSPGNNYQVWDGCIIYDAAEQCMKSEALIPQAKVGTLLDQFSFIKRAPQLDRSCRDLGESPLKWTTRILENDVYHAVTDPSMTASDVLDNFYHEFISYGEGDGSDLDIVLTPEHVTTLIAELIDVNTTDHVLDPTAGTAPPLIAAMQRMFDNAGDNAAMREDIRKNHLYGIKLQDKLFAIGTTNMILRGDGKANFRRGSIFEAPVAEMCGDTKLSDDIIALGHGFIKVLLNPPYSQAKGKSTRSLSELAFIERTLEFLNPGGKLAVIVPQSAMVGKTKEDKACKRYILEHHTLEIVIMMNPMTFTNSGHTPHTVITIFTAGRKHREDQKVRFVDFEKDGWVVAPHHGLVDDGTVASRRKHLLEVLRGDAQDDTSFIARSEVAAEDEWQHSYLYFNDVPPTYEDFMSTVADYVTWQVDMHTHGPGNLITPSMSVTSDEEGKE